MLLWVGCIAGALEEDEYKSKLKAAGFEQSSIEPTRIYKVEDAHEFLADKGIDVNAMAKEVDGKFMGAFIRAVKPRDGTSCCAPMCCN
jgi:arsenite methyltransferase